MSTGYPETMRHLLGTVQRELTEQGLPWDGFAAIAWFDGQTGRASVAAWCYRCNDPHGRSIGAASTVALFERLRDIVVVTSGPVGALVLTQILASGAHALRVLAPSDPQLRSTLAPGAAPQALGAALRPAELPLTGVPARGLSVQRPGATDPAGVLPDDLLPRLSAEDARLLAGYLDAGATLARTTFRVTDPWSGDDRRQLTLIKHTDGTWHWDDVVTHYVRSYRLNPDPAFLEHARARNFQPPAVTPERVSEVIDQLFDGSAEPGPAWGLRLDGTHVLPTGAYCVYDGQVLLYTGGDDVRTRLGVPPGVAIPAGFEAVADPDADRPTIAYGWVPTPAVSSFRLAITFCRYKGAKATVIKIDGPRWVIKIDATAPGQDGREVPVLGDWEISPGVRVVSKEKIFTWIDADEASQVYTVLIRCHPAKDHLLPMYEILGRSTDPAEPDDWVYNHPSAEVSPFIAPGPAMGVLAGRLEAGYPLIEPQLARLRHGWWLKVAAPVQDLYYIDDDGEVFTCPASVPPAKVSEMITKQLVERHPAVKPPSGGWPY